MDQKKDVERKNSYQDEDFALAYSFESAHTADSDFESKLKVRSSIRDTMESIVNKAKKTYTSSKIKVPKSPSMRRKARSFFKRDKDR